MKDRVVWGAIGAGLVLSAVAQSQVGCALFSPLPSSSPGANGKTTVAGSTAAAFPTDPVKIASAASAKTAIKAFKNLNSSSNFTMPMGNNFTMPIGNNFTMPIGNNLKGKGATHYSVSTVVANSLAFGFVPLAAGTDVSAVNPNPNGLPSAGSVPYTGQVQGPNATGSLTLSSWGDDAPNTGYQDVLKYTDLVVNVGGVPQHLNGTYTLQESGSWPSTTPDTTTFGGAILLGQNFVPTAISHYKEQMSLYSDSQQTERVVQLNMDRSNFSSFKVPITGNAIPIPGSVAVSGSLGSKQNGGALGFNLASNAVLTGDNPSFSISGYLCTDGNASCGQSDSSAIREDFQLDLNAATSHLTFTKLPAVQNSQSPDPSPSPSPYGWQLILNFDYGAMVLNGVAGTSALTGSGTLVDSSGNPVEDARIIKGISFDASGNPQITYTDGSTEPWKL